MNHARPSLNPAVAERAPAPPGDPMRLASAATACSRGSDHRLDLVDLESVAQGWRQQTRVCFRHGALTLDPGAVVHQHDTNAPLAPVAAVVVEAFRSSAAFLLLDRPPRVRWNG